jgi:hypothetical protein
MKTASFSMTSVVAAFILHLSLPASAQEAPSRWDCSCDKQPCKCVPLPSSNPHLCNIACPRGTKFIPDCSCAPVSGNQPDEAERRRQILERLEQERKKQHD